MVNPSWYMSKKKLLKKFIDIILFMVEVGRVGRKGYEDLFGVVGSLSPFEILNSFSLANFFFFINFNFNFNSDFRNFLFYFFGKCFGGCDEDWFPVDIS